MPSAHTVNPATAPAERDDARRLDLYRPTHEALRAAPSRQPLELGSRDAARTRARRNVLANPADVLAPMGAHLRQEDDVLHPLPERTDPLCVTVVETEHDVHRARIGIVSDELGRPLEPIPLTCVVPDTIWHARQALRFGPLSITTRMTVVRLRDGSLWIRSPIAPTPELVATLGALGPVGHVIAPNKSHHLNFAPFMDAHPGARGWIAPGLAGKRSDLATMNVLYVGTPWPDLLPP